jgi:hypothetical protein
MPVKKEENFSFGGVDSRSNPANFPINRAIRCLNFSPIASGQLRLRSGYSVPMPATNDSAGATTIHSLLYYEQFSASYLGPQFALYGKLAGLYQFNMGSGVSTQIATLSNSNPWGHFRARNSVFISNGTDFKQWDGVTLRPVGIRAPNPNGESVVVYDTTAYANSNSTAANGGNLWNNIGNALGAPDGVYATAGSNIAHGTSDNLLSGFSLAVPASTPQGITVTLTGHVQGSGSPPGTQLYVNVQLYRAGVAVGSPKQQLFSSTSDVPLIFGSISDLWGDSGWTPTNLNDPSFNVVVWVSGHNGSGVILSLDAVNVSIHSQGSPLPVAVNFTTNAAGNWTLTQLSGYQFWMAYYNPITQHMGNAIPIGGLLTNTSYSTVALSLTSLPNLSAINPEWVKAFGRTNDGGQVPYWLTDGNGNHIVAANNATQATLLIGPVDVLSQMPSRNYVPPMLDKFARVGTRVFGALSGSPTMYYSNDISDITNANYVGNPEESWPPDQTEILPSGEEPTAIHAYRLEGWFYSRTALFIWSQFLQQQGANPWRGPYPGGCPGQRAFVETPYGPFWFSAEGELCTFMSDGVISVSDEYEAALLGKISRASSNMVELAYLRDPINLTDEVVVRGFDANGNVVIVVHDFRLQDERSPHGQGYNFQYNGVTVNTFAGAGYTPRFNVYDTSGRMRLWAGAKEGVIAQLEDGSSSDNGTVYSGDYIGLVGLGPNRPGLVELEWQGDGNLQVSWTKDYNNTLAQFTQSEIEQIPGEPSRWAAKMFGEGRWLYSRLQLTSHPADGSFALTDPVFLPLPTYGVVNMVDLKLGAERPEGR